VKVCKGLSVSYNRQLVTVGAQLFRHCIASEVTDVERRCRRRSASNVSRHRLHVDRASHRCVAVPLLRHIPLHHPQPSRHRLPSYLRRPVRRDRQSRTVPARVLLVPLRLRLRSPAGADRRNVCKDSGSTAASGDRRCHSLDAAQPRHRRPEARGEQTKGGSLICSSHSECNYIV